MSLLPKLKTALEPFGETLLFTIPLKLLLLCIASRIRRKTAPYPPGPKGLPLIGNMNIMEQLTHRGLAKQYGGVLHLRMGFLHMDVMFGGIETVASGIEWAIAELMRSPGDLRRVQQELADVAGLDRRPRKAHISKMHGEIDAAAAPTDPAAPPRDGGGCSSVREPRVKGSRVMINA